jgi:hypothetical protein
VSAEVIAPEEGFCSASEDQTHCEHWWDCEPCHFCGFDGGGEDCDCPRHNPDATNEATSAEPGGT